jgi:hypothetical protein
MPDNSRRWSKAKRKAAKQARNALQKLPKSQRKNFTKLMGLLRRRLKDAGDPKPIRDEGFVLKLMPIDEVESVLLAYADVAAKGKRLRAVIGGLAEDGFYVMALQEEEYEKHVKYYPVGSGIEDPRDQDQEEPPWDIKYPVGSTEGPMEEPGEDK